jgi:multicomponent K+:H+ antiporter subunit E
MRRRLLPSPVLSAALLVLWLLLTQSTDAASLLFGALVAVLGPRLTASLRPTPVRMRRPLVAARLLGHVLVDSLRSAVSVVATILGRREIRSGFVRVPLDVRDPNALAVLAMIVAATPGTAWAELAADRSVLLLHVLSLDDGAATVATVKRRYERPLMEIFE